MNPMCLKTRLTSFIKCQYAIQHSLSLCNYSTQASSPDYQFLQRSKVPMMHFQKSLPRLPVPELEKTLQRYLKAQQALLSAEQFQHTQKLVTDFQQGIGKTLQTELTNLDKANKHTSYISAPWFEMYLRDRQPLPLNYNPFMAFADMPSGYNDQLTNATNFLISAVRFMRSLRAGVLEPEVFHLNPKKSDTSTFRTVTGLLPSSLSWYGAYLFKAFPLDMSQFPSLFNSTRIPEKGIDRLLKDESARHVLVMRNGHFYVFDVIDSAGNILEPSKIHGCLANVLSKPPTPSDCPLGILTTQERNKWAEQRKHLASLGNAEALRLIDTALFNLVLDDDILGGDLEGSIRYFLHGTGTNRWFDKSFSLIMSKDARSCVNFEHSWGDGVAVMRFFNELFKDAGKNPRITPESKSADAAGLVKQLQFNVDERIKEDVQRATNEYTALCKSLQVNYLMYEKYGKDFCKKHSISPDAIMQMAFQAAYHRITGQRCGSYESCSTSAFKHGRTETIRPCTMATNEFSDALNRRDKPSGAEIRALIEKCSKVHGELTKDAAMGQGFDRHLFGLRKMAENNGHPLPDIYSDPAYAFINHNIISTSTLSSPAVVAGGFGPVVADGLGIAYVIKDQMLGTVVTSYSGQRDGSQFVQCLQPVFEEMYNILDSTQPSSKA